MTPPESHPHLVLVTGGAGYVGSTACRELLARGYRVRIVDNLRHGGDSLTSLLNHPECEFVRGDIRDERTLRECVRDVDSVVHLAAIVGDVPCQRDPKTSIETNLDATVALANIARDAGVSRFVLASTCSNYGVADTATPACERRELRPVSLYAETKVDCERATHALQSDQFHPVSLRFASAYGISARMRFDLVVNSFAYEAHRDGRIEVYAANSWRPHIHVVDMARILVEMLQQPTENISGEVFNAGFTDENFQKHAIAEIVREENPGLEVATNDAIDDPRSYRVDFSKLEGLTRLKPARTVRDGVREILSACRSGVLDESAFERTRLKRDLG